MGGVGRWNLSHMEQPRPVIGAETEEIGMSCSAWLPKGEVGTLGLGSAVGAGAALGRTRFKVIDMAFH